MAKTHSFAVSGPRGRVTPHHRFLLRLHLQQVDAVDTAIAQIDQEVEANLAPFRAAAQNLTAIPGVGALASRIIVSEIGIDMSRFPDRRAPPLVGRSVPPQ